MKIICQEWFPVAILANRWTSQNRWLVIFKVKISHFCSLRMNLNGWKVNLGQKLNNNLAYHFHPDISFDQKRKSLVLKKTWKLVGMTKWRPTDGNTVKYREFMSTPIKSLTEDKGEMGKMYIVWLKGTSGQSFQHKGLHIIFGKFEGNFPELILGVSGQFDSKWTFINLRCRGQLCPSFVLEYVRQSVLGRAVVHFVRDKHLNLYNDSLAARAI